MKFGMLAVLPMMALVVATPAAAAAPKPRPYKNCTALNKVYPHGVGLRAAVDKTSTKAVTTFRVDAKVYGLNDGRVRPDQDDLDRDNDRIACERS